MCFVLPTRPLLLTPITKQVCVFVYRQVFVSYVTSAGSFLSDVSTALFVCMCHIIRAILAYSTFSFSLHFCTNLICMRRRIRFSMQFSYMLSL